MNQELALLKPHPAGNAFQGNLDESLIAWLPENSSLRPFLGERNSVCCDNHITGPRAPAIAYGEQVFASMYPTGGRNGVATYCVRFYCSPECQRNHAVGLQSRVRRRK